MIHAHLPATLAFMVKILLTLQVADKVIPSSVANPESLNNSPVNDTRSMHKVDHWHKNNVNSHRDIRQVQQNPESTVRYLQFAVLILQKVFLHAEP